MISGRPLSGNARKTISILDRMKDIGLSKYVNLPRIVLCGKKESKVGEQSSGKTSLIESIIGLEFMGAGVRTGRPIELKLQHCPGKGKSYLGLLEIEWIFEAEPDKKYKDIKEVAKRIE
jgi:GTPase SAR1 family protein